MKAIDFKEELQVLAVERKMVKSVHHSATKEQLEQLASEFTVEEFVFCEGAQIVYFLMKENNPHSVMISENGKIVNYDETDLVEMYNGCKNA